jgi:phosphoenolpyruvate---glycerone phosphotransferase subunit DhaL
MLDVWLPASQKIKETSTQTEDIIETLSQGSIVAHEAMQLTKDMLSKKGRSSKLGERSKGHIDPGAASSELIFRTFYEVCKKL